MKAKILITALCCLPMMANAAIPYRAQHVSSSADSDSLSGPEHRFYIGGAYDFSMWQNYTDDNGISISGKNTSGFDAFLGLRISDVWRIEANYIHTDARWNQFSIQSDSAMINAIIDARIDGIYNILYNQMIVPYVGIGVGATWMDTDTGVSLEHKIVPTFAAMAGIGIEFNPIFALDFGYRYIYMNNPDINGLNDFNPSGHQFRAGARISF